MKICALVAHTIADPHMHACEVLLTEAEDYLLFRTYSHITSSLSQWHCSTQRHWEHTDKHRAYGTPSMQLRCMMVVHQFIMNREVGSSRHIGPRSPAG